jgi:hypothetical protein
MRQRRIHNRAPRSGGHGLKLPKVTLLVGLVVVAVLMMLIGPVAYEPHGWQTTYSRSPSGYRAFFELAQTFRGSNSVERWRRLPITLDGQGKALLMLEPQADLISVNEAGLDPLVGWVKAGNDLILVPRATSVDVGELMGQKFEIVNDRGSYYTSIDKVLEAFNLEVELDRSTSFPYSENTLQFREADQPAQDDVIVSKSSFALESASDELVPRFFAADEPVALEAEVGEGRVVVLLAPNWFLNKSIAKDGHAAAVLSVLAPYGHNGLLVDEFFHGLPAVGGIVALLFQPPFLWLTLSCMGLLGLLIWSSVYRTQPLYDPPPPSRRRKSEHLEALGQLLASTKNHSWVVQQLIAGLEADLRASLRLSPTSPIPICVNFLRRRNPELADDFTSLCAEGRELNTWEKDARSCVEWGRRVHHLRQRLNHE